MHWYKIAKQSRIENHLRRLIRDYEDDGPVIWVRGETPDVFVSVGDWAQNSDELVHDIRRMVGKGAKIECDYEVGSPGAGWKRL